MQDRRKFVDDCLGKAPKKPLPPLTAAERDQALALQSSHAEHVDCIYEGLKQDAQATYRSMSCSPQSDSGSWDEVVSSSLDDYRSGRSLMRHLGADRLIDPATTGMLLAMRRSLNEDSACTDVSQQILIDLAVIAFANAMRIQSMIGNTALIMESEFFCQPSLRAKIAPAGQTRGHASGLEIDEHVARLRDSLLPVVERFHRMARENVEALTRNRQGPSLAVEREKPIRVVWDKQEP